MSDPIFDLIQQAADRHGGCEPRWLVRRKVPTFNVQESKTPGPTIILLHGLFGAMSNWETSAPLMSKYANTIIFGFPLITGHRSEVKVKALAAYLEYYIRKNNLGKVILCGNSMGGHVAMRLCLASPDLVDAMILSATSGLYEHSVDTLPVRIGEKFVREHMAKVFYNHQFITDAAVHEILSILTNRMNTLNLIHAARSAKKDNLKDRLPEINVPTLLLWGENDNVTTMDVARQFNQYIPNSELISIDKCGHAPMIEYPDWFSDNVEGFLRKHGRI